MYSKVRSEEMSAKYNNFSCSTMHTYPFIKKLIETSPSVAHLKQPLVQAVTMLVKCVRSGGKILICGNGGSAADAEHIVGELMKGFLLPRPPLPEQIHALEIAFPDSGAQLAANLQRPIPAISLVASVSLATAFANDVAAEFIFAQQVFGLAKQEDVLWGLSTSGNSSNILHAFQVARAFNVKTLGFTGGNGGKMATLCDVEIRAPHTRTPAIQEIHLPLYHAICAEVEAILFNVSRNNADTYFE